MDQDRRNRALRIIRALAALHGCLGALLLVMSVVSITTHGEVNNGVPPYYTGSLTALALEPIMSVVCVVILYKARHCENKLDASKAVGCWIQMYVVCVFISAALGLIGLILTGVTGVCGTTECSYLTRTSLHRAVAVISLVFILAGVATSAISLTVMCVYSDSFGVRLCSRGQFRVSADPARDAYVAGPEEPGATPVVELKPATRPPGYQRHKQQERQQHQHNENHEHNHHYDPRLASPPADFSTHHLQHYLTQQYKRRIRNRRKKKKRKHRENGDFDMDAIEAVSRHNEGQVPYVLPPLIGRQPLQHIRLPPHPNLSTTDIVIPPTSPSITPPPLPRPPFMPPSPHEHPAFVTRPISPERTRAIFPRLPMSSTPPPPSDSPTSQPSMNLSPTPPNVSDSTLTQTPSPPGVVHVIPYGGYLDDDDDAPPSYH